MRELPMIFNAAMVRAILDGRKTQTRRILKPRRDWNFGCELAACEIAGEINSGDYRNSAFGQPGDRLWIKETHLAWWKLNPADPTGPRLFSHVAAFAADGYELEPGERWIPSIHMRREACRLVLEITDLRAEKLGSIQSESAKAEGIEEIARGGAWRNYEMDGNWFHGEHTGPMLSFSSLWRSIYGADSWQANPWVYVISFRVIEGAR